ncbi:MAG TPA: hypothetical protein VNZ48_18790 [Xanthobacteraceae bacterium]|nr:hypothetical protein [Xanthobacteraceae bacterium]
MNAYFDVSVIQLRNIVEDRTVLRKGSWGLVANLAVFGVCAVLAFARNINALFYHYDGSYMLVDARDQLSFGQPFFAYSNNFLQSIGNIQVPQNARLLFFLWPIGWFSNPQVAKVASYLILAGIVFLAAYGLARLLSQSRTVALTAGWILGFLTTPFVPRPFFYEILAVAPAVVLVVAAPVVGFWLVSRAGRSSLLADVAIAIGLIALTSYLLAATSLALPILASAVAAYVGLALFLARRRSELLRKFAVLAAVLIVAGLLRWPWYALGLFLDTTPNFFPHDYTTVYHDETYASIVFLGMSTGWSGPLLVASSALGAVLSLKSADFELRAWAWTLLALIVAFLGAGIALAVMPRWILPPPIYLEIAVWPLYAVFAAIAALSICNFAAERLAQAKLRWGHAIRPRWIVLPALFVLAAILVLRKPPTPSVNPFPPQITPVVTILKANIAIDSSSAFKGRIVTVMPIAPGRGDAWEQQSLAAAEWAKLAGNDEMSIGLWYYRIPTLFEYNQFLSPAFHALVKRALQRPPIAHQRNITVFTYPDARLLKLLGVRYVLMPRPDAALGELRATEDRAGEPWGLIELPEPNLATYSPTSVETRRDLASALDFVVDDKVDLTARAVAQDDVRGPLTPARSAALSMAGKDLHVVADSDGRSLVIVPVEFSHCIELSETHQGAGDGSALLRIDGLLTGIAFDRHLDAVLSFRFGPLRDAFCRWQDYRDMKSMLQ